MKKTTTMENVDQVISGITLSYEFRRQEHEVSISLRPYYCCNVMIYATEQVCYYSFIVQGGQKGRKIHRNFWGHVSYKHSEVISSFPGVTVKYNVINLVNYSQTTA